MKKKLFLLAIVAIASFQLFGQELGKTWVLPTNAFNNPQQSGFYETGGQQSGLPKTSWPYPYAYLLNLRTVDSKTTQFQISTYYIDDDRVFFRKMYPHTSTGINPKWQEFATRGENKFKGNQYITGILYANEIKVETTKWSDFVFGSDYNLRPLSEVKAHIEEFKHLPDVPSEAEVLKGGINVSDMTSTLLQKIEELTLYVIQQDEKIKELNDKLSGLENLNK